MPLTSKETLETNVLIVGAGPAGLILAYLLQLAQIDYLLIEKRKDPSKLSKATGIHRNTMRLLNHFGLAEDILQASILLERMERFDNFKLLQTIIFEQGSASYDKNISINQFDFEQILRAKLAQPILSEYEFLDIQECGKNGVSAKIRHTSDKEIGIKSQYLIGADGANSRVRETLGVTYDGEQTTEQAFTFDAKVVSELTPNTCFVHETGSKRLVAVPLPGEGHYKFSGKLYDDSPDMGNMPNIVFERTRFEVDPSTIGGFSLYHTQSKLAASFGNERIILIGDAAHTFFPAGGYGLNMAIEDAFCLSWRINFSLINLMSELILDYCTERREEALKFQTDARDKKKKLGSQDSTGLKDKAAVESQAYTASQTGVFKRIDPKSYDSLLNTQFRDEPSLQPVEPTVPPGSFTSSLFYNKTTNKYLVVRPDLFVAEVDEIEKPQPRLGIAL